MTASTVWVALGGATLPAGSIIYVDPTTLLPTSDVDNLYYDSVNKRMHLVTAGDHTGVDTLNLYGQVDSYLVNSAQDIPNNILSAFSVSSSRGTPAVPVVLNTLDTVGKFSGYGYTGTVPAYQELGGIYVSAEGSPPDLGGELNFYTKRTGLGGVSTLGMKLDRVGRLRIGPGATSIAQVFDGISNGRPLVVGHSSTDTTGIGSISSITLANLDLTTNNVSQFNFAAGTDVNAVAVYSSVILSAIYGARTANQYPTGQFVIFNSKSLNAAPTESFRIAVDGTTTIGGLSSAPALKVITSGGQNRWIEITGSNGANPTFQVGGGGTMQFTGSILIYGGNVVAQQEISVCSTVAIPAGGTAGQGVKVSSTANFGTFFGSGAPTLAAAKGSLYLRSDGSAVNNRAYINTDGGTTWTAITTVA